MAEPISILAAFTTAGLVLGLIADVNDLVKNIAYAAKNVRIAKKSALNLANRIEIIQDDIHKIEGLSDDAKQDFEKHLRRFKTIFEEVESFLDKMKRTGVAAVSKRILSNGKYEQRFKDMGSLLDSAVVDFTMTLNIHHEAPQPHTANLFFVISATNPFLSTSVANPFLSTSVANPYLSINAVPTKIPTKTPSLTPTKIPTKSPMTCTDTCSKVCHSRDELLDTAKTTYTGPAGTNGDPSWSTGATNPFLSISTANPFIPTLYNSLVKPLLIKTRTL